MVLEIGVSKPIPCCAFVMIAHQFLQGRLCTGSQAKISIRPISKPQNVPSAKQT